MKDIQEKRLDCMDALTGHGRCNAGREKRAEEKDDRRARLMCKVGSQIAAPAFASRAIHGLSQLRARLFSSRHDVLPSETQAAF